MKLKTKLLTAAIVLAALALPVQEARAQACTHYASPTGTGVGTSSNSPFKIANFWPLAKPGYTLCLLDGKYTGSASMINPPQNLNGTASARITVRALNDGKVTINGQGSLMPVRLYRNNYFVLEGFNALDSKNSVVAIEGSSYNIIRRVAAWDAADNNTNIFGVHGGSHNLLEDVAGWGIARAVFSASQGGNNTTIRRAWGRWGGSHVVGGKNVFQLAYNAYDVVCENCIGQFSGERMKENYVLMDYYGKPWTGKGAGTYTDYKMDQPGQIFHATSGDSCSRMKLLGSLAYVLSTDRFQGVATVLVTQLDCITIQDTAAVFQEGYSNKKRTFHLGSLKEGSAKNLVANRLTGIGEGSWIHSDWKQTSIHQGSNLSAVPNPWTTTTGANLCFRYENGVRTTNPLWPWPMNQRIIDAMAGGTPVNLTAVVQKLLGSTPASCTGGSNGMGSEPTTAVSIPVAPIDLRVNR
ncbi:MAG: hypothetical protein GEU77_08270 [Deltaproteobacteria bacterium]|nr:hypothetical protein [Deltaproteobacteria bacterium]